MGANNFQVSAKLHDGRIYVIGGETFAEFKTNLAEVLGPDGAESSLSTMAGSIEAITIEQAVTNLAPLNPSPAVPSTPTQEPQTFTPSTGPTGKSCKHGPMTKRQGASAKGPWKAYMCSTPKGTPDQCEPIFLRRNEAEWNSF